MLNSRKLHAAVVLILAMGVCIFGGRQAQALPSVLIVAADDSPPTAKLMGTGRFSAVDYHDARLSTPSLGQLTGYDSVLAYNNGQLPDPTALGNVLADYVDAGGRLAICTYLFSSPWALRGRVMTPGYSPLVDLGTNGDVSGNLVVVQPHPLFDGIDVPGVSYFHNSNFAHAGLDPGATLLATDGAGHNMIAVRDGLPIVAMNLFPSTPLSDNNAEFYELTANALIPEPATLALLAVGGIGLIRRRRRRAGTIHPADSSWETSAS